MKYHINQRISEDSCREEKDMEWLTIFPGAPDTAKYERIMDRKNVWKGKRTWTREWGKGIKDDSSSWSIRDCWRTPTSQLNTCAKEKMKRWGVIGVLTQSYVYFESWGKWKPSIEISRWKWLVHTVLKLYYDHNKHENVAPKLLLVSRKPAANWSADNSAV